MIYHVYDGACRLYVYNSWPTLGQRRAEARLFTMYKITNNLLDIKPNQYLMPRHS